MNSIDRRTFATGLLAAALTSRASLAQQPAILGTTSQIPTLTIPAMVTTFTTSGYRAPNDGGGATWVRASGTYDGRTMVKDIQGNRWLIGNPRVRPEMFGAKADGVTDSTSGIQLALFTGKPIDLSAGTYLISAALILDLRATAGGVPVELAGAGMGVTRIIQTSFLGGISFLGSTAGGTPFYIHDFSIGRTNQAAFTGTTGPHTVVLEYGNNMLVSNVEEFGSLGMGILLVGCGKYEITGCYVHDHKSGSTHLSGTDGIHVDTSVGPGLVHHNTVQNVGDDPISHGSYSGSTVSGLNGVQVYANKVTNTAGSIKVFGNAANIVIHDNQASNSSSAGICLWDDQNVGMSWSIQNTQIINNSITACGGTGASGGVSLLQNAGTGVQAFSSVLIAGNAITNCAYGVSIFSNVPTKTSDQITIQGNQIVGSQKQGLLIGAVKSVSITGNTVVSSGADGLRFNSTLPGAFSITNNTFLGFCTAGAAGSYGGMLIYTNPGNAFTVTGNAISDAPNRNPKYWGIAAQNLSKSALVAGNTIDPVTTRGVSANLA